MKKQLLALCAATMMMSMTACDSKMDPNDPQSVRKYLTKQQIAFTPNQFVSYAVNGDTAKMTRVPCVVFIGCLRNRTVTNPAAAVAPTIKNQRGECFFVAATPFLFA